jgi:molybdenum cofactor cytidylyltransferase
MGTSKALLDAGGTTFLGRILILFHRGDAHPRIVVVRDAGGPEAGEARRHGADVAVNPDPTPGPISSLQEGIRRLSPEVPGAFFCPVDHPLFRIGTVKALTRALMETGAPILAPSFRGRSGHPVLFHRDLFDELLEEGLPRGARTVVDRYHGERILVDVSDPGILVDIDTPDEYARHFS